MHVGKVLLKLADILLCLTLLAVGTAFAEDFTRVDRQPTVVSNQQPVNGKDMAAHEYHGYLRLFVAEPVSRYKNDLGQNHLHGVIGYPLDIEINLTYPDTLRGDIVYNDTLALSENNIEVIGAVYEFAGHAGYSDPPNNPYTAHWVEAATVGTPGNPGVDQATLPYTHTVFVEYATRFS